MIILFTILSLRLYAYDVDKVYEGDNLDSIANRNYYKYSNQYKTITEYKSKLKLWNPRIENWNKLTGLIRCN